MLKAFRRFTPILTLIAFAVVALTATLVFAQTGEPPLPPAANQWQVVILAAYATAFSLITQGLKALWPRLPRFVVMLIPYGFGVLVTLLSGMTGLGGWRGFLAALGAHALYEWASTIKDWGFAGGTS